MVQVQDRVQIKLNNWKAGLINLTKRNPLLKFPERGNHVQFHIPSVDLLFERLLHGQRLQVNELVDLEKYKLKSKKKDSSLIEEPPLEDREKQEEEERRKEVIRRLERQLNRIRLDAKSALEERGVHTLYLAFGFLHWKEAENSDIKLKSPLLLMPVGLWRRSSRDAYMIERTGDDVIFNPSLIQKLKNDFGMDLPEIEDEQEIGSVSQFLEKYKKTYFNELDDASVHLDVFLSKFEFRSLVMYKELEEYGEMFGQHPMIQSLSGVENSAVINQDYKEIRIGDYEKSNPSEDSFQILDADSSQQEAILAAKNGLSFIMHGPPGTGKSQTIANIIAECLAAGKRVLFVSEKLTALEVVKRRLEQQKLGDFCLELHSDKTNKKSVLNELERVLLLKRSPKYKEMPFHVLDHTKAKLNQYVDELHMPMKPLDVSVFQIHGEIAKLDELPDLQFEFSQIKKITKGQLEIIKDLLNQLDQQKKIFSQEDRHRWKDTKLKRFSLEMQGNIKSKFTQFANWMDGLSHHLQNVYRFMGVDWEQNLKVIPHVLEYDRFIDERQPFPRGWLVEPTFATMNEVEKNLSDHMKRFHEYAQLAETLKGKYRLDILQEDLEQLYFQLTTKHRDIWEKYTKESLFTQLFAKETEIKQQLGKLVELITRLEQLQANIVEKIDFEIGDNDIDRLECLGLALKCLRQASKPTSIWFDPNRKEELFKVYNEAERFVTEFVEEKEEIDQKYDRPFLSEDIEGLKKRFVMNYSSFFRYFKGAYYEDQKLIRYHRKNPKFSYGEALRELKIAGRVLEKEKLFPEKEKRWKAVLGARYQGTETNWAELKDQIQNITKLIASLHGADLATFKIQLQEVSQAMVLETARLSDQLADTLAQFEQTWLQITKYFTLQSPFKDKKMNLAELKERIILLRQTLDDVFQVKERVAANYRGLGQKDYFELVNELGELKRLQKMTKQIRSEGALFSRLYGELYKEFETDWKQIVKSFDWAKEVKKRFPRGVPESLVETLADEERASCLKKEFAQIKNALKEKEDHFRFFATVFDIDQPIWGGAVLTDVHLPDAVSRLHQWAETSYQLEEWIHLQRLLQNISEWGLKDFIEQIRKQKAYQYSYQQLFLKRFYKLWLDYIYPQLPMVDQFKKEMLEEMLEKFRELDQKQLTINGARVHEILMKRKEQYLQAQNMGNPQLNILHRELAKKKRHKPIRKLFSEIPDLLYVLKPCMMMSQLSVSQFLDPTIFTFDVVIFDEASQITPENAVGAILRGKQLIVAGDNKQLPPTNFFNSSFDLSDEWVDREIEDLYETYESILDECAIFLPSKRLKWHYRSKHESLIAFSNREIYDNELYTFPSTVNGEHDGVSFVYVKDGVYDRGRSAKNRREAQKVAELVFEHFKRSPHRSLGVIAFSSRQEEAIRDQLELLRRKQPDMEKFFKENTDEPFFIKNLENVQGDERDTILFSVGYGKDEYGKLHYHFGPLNRAGGERRLNVAATRAKYEVKLVSSIRYNDLDDTKLNQRGPQLLKAYLYYAEHKGRFSPNNGIVNNGEFDSPLEEDVYRTLTAKGLMLHKQVGCSSYRIDLAVVDPSQPGRYLLGIECDGASYHSSRTARDRDRLRQQVLESMGWKIHRIWSQDWFKNKKIETEKIVKLVHQLNSSERKMRITKREVYSSN